MFEENETRQCKDFVYDESVYGYTAVIEVSDTIKLCNKSD